MEYLSITVGEFGWRGLRGLRFGLDRPAWESPRQPYAWYPLWCLYLGPVVLRWLQMAPEPEF